MTVDGIAILICCIQVLVFIPLVLAFFYFFMRCPETEKKTRRLKELNLKVRVIKKQEIKIGAEIDRGNFGTVKKGEWNKLEEKKKVVAVKFLILPDDDFNHIILKEVYIFDKLDHENIIKFLAVYGTKKYYCLVMEYFEGKTIDIIEYNSIIGNDVVKILSVKNSISHQICKALTYLHRNKIYHGDIRNLNNTLVSDKFKVKVLDFGSSNFFIEENSNDINELKYGIMSKKDKFDNNVDTDKKNTVHMLLNLYTQYEGQYLYLNRNQEFEDEIKKACFDNLSKNLSSVFDKYLSD